MLEQKLYRSGREGRLRAPARNNLYRHCQCPHGKTDKEWDELADLNDSATSLTKTHGIVNKKEK